MAKRKRGRPPGVGLLNRERIAAAALARVDTHGLAALTLRRLAADLGCEAMALYNHFPDKGSLLDGVVDQLMEEVIVPPEGLPWLERLAFLMDSYSSLVRTHPRAFSLLTNRRFNTARSLQVFDAILAVLASAGFGAADRAYQFRRVGYFLNGSGLAEVASRALADDATRPLLESTPHLPDLPQVTAAAPFLTLEQLGVIHARAQAALLADIVRDAESVDR